MIADRWSITMRSFTEQATIVLVQGRLVGSQALPFGWTVAKLKESRAQ